MNDLEKPFKIGDLVQHDMGDDLFLVLEIVEFSSNTTWEVYFPEGLHTTWEVYFLSQSSGKKQWYFCDVLRPAGVSDE